LEKNGIKKVHPEIIFGPQLFGDFWENVNFDNCAKSLTTAYGRLFLTLELAPTRRNRNITIQNSIVRNVYVMQAVAVAGIVKCQRAMKLANILGIPGLSTISLAPMLETELQRVWNRALVFAYQLLPVPLDILPNLVLVTLTPQVTFFLKQNIKTMSGVMTR